MEVREENKMGVMPVKKLILTMSVPMMLSMLVQALYNVVDSIFVARLGEQALTAVTLAFPLQNFMIAVASGTGVGVNALLSRSLGEKKFDRSDAAANNGIFLSLISFVIFVLVGLFGAAAFISSQTPDPEIVTLGAQYIGICCTFSIGLFMQIISERLLQSTGRTIFSMASQMAGAIVNIIFDPILIFGLFGFPALGVAGAAYATVLGQCVGAVIGIFCNIRYNKDIHISLSRILHPDAAIIKPIYYVGVPSILMMAIGSLMTYGMNQILGTFTAVASTAIAVFGVYFKLQSFFFMPVFGLNNGVVPVIAYNYGAGNFDRIRKTLRFSVSLAVGIMLVGTIVFQLAPTTLLRLFDASDDMLAIGIPALRIISISFPLAGVSILLGSIFQAFSMSYYSLIISVGRQLAVLLPVAYLLSRIGIVNDVWWAFPISELVSFILSLIFFRKVYKMTVLAPKE